MIYGKEGLASIDTAHPVLALHPSFASLDLAMLGLAVEVT
jgi:hypothetical protein